MQNRQKVPPLPFLLSSLITSRPPRKAYVEDDGYPQDEEAEQLPEEESKQARARRARPSPQPR